jgi:hypothetical protein
MERDEERPALPPFVIDHAPIGHGVPASESDHSVTYSSKYFGTGGVIKGGVVVSVHRAGEIYQPPGTIGFS